MGALRQVGAGLIEAVELRLQLLGLDLEREKRGLFLAVLLGTASALTALMALLLGNLAIVAIWWERRVEVLLGMALFYLVVAMLLGVWARRRFRSARPFAATIEELKKDRAALGGG